MRKQNKTPLYRKWGTEKKANDDIYMLRLGD